MSKRRYASLHAAVARSAATAIHIAPSRHRQSPCRVRVVTRDKVHHIIVFKTRDEAELWAWDFARTRSRLSRIYCWEWHAGFVNPTRLLLGRERLRFAAAVAEGRA